MPYDIKLLQKSPLFRDLPPEGIMAFLDCTQPIYMEGEAGSILREQGDPLQHILLLLKGSLLLQHAEYGGHTTIVDVIRAGEIFGQSSVFSESPFTQSRIVAETPVHYLLFKGSVFYQHCSLACACHQTVTRNMIFLLSDQLRRLSEKISYLSCSSLKGKIALYLLNQSTDVSMGEPFRIPFNREGLAAYLNTQRPSLSRALCQMREDGWIDYNRSVFRILDPEALANLE